MRRKSEWRAPDPMPVRKRKRIVTVVAVVVTVALVVVGGFYSAPWLGEKRAEHAVDRHFSKVIDKVVSSPAVEIRSRARMKTTDSPVYFTAVRLEDGTMVGDIRGEENGYGLPVVDAGDTLYAQGDKSMWPLIGLESDYSGWLQVESDKTVNIAAASITQQSVRDVVDNKDSTRDGLTMTSPDGVTLTVDEDSDIIHVTHELSNGSHSEHTIRPVSGDEIDAAKQAVANAVNGVGARVIVGADGAMMVERFTDRTPQQTVEREPAESMEDKEKSAKESESLPPKQTRTVEETASPTKTVRGEGSQPARRDPIEVFEPSEETIVVTEDAPVAGDAFVPSEPEPVVQDNPGGVSVEGGNDVITD